MPVFTPGPITSGSARGSCARSSTSTGVSGGTTLARAIASTPAGSRPEPANRLRTRIPYSSAVCSRRVVSRQWARSSGPSKTPSTVLVLPTSIVSSTCRSGPGRPQPARPRRRRGAAGPRPRARSRARPRRPRRRAARQHRSRRCAPPRGCPTRGPRARARPQRPAQAPHAGHRTRRPAGEDRRRHRIGARARAPPRARSDVTPSRSSGGRLRGVERHVHADAQHDPLDARARRTRPRPGCPRACGPPPARRSAT